MSNMILFQKPEFGRVRCFVIDGEPWFVAKDVCECLDIGNPTQAIMRLDADEKSTLSLNEGGPDRNIVNECGVYNLVLGSRKQEAKAFKRWIVHEVIPQIRKTGNYSAKQDIKPMSDGELIARALIAANSTIERIEKEREAEKKVLQLQIDQTAQERDEAIRKRSYISSTREATIMGRLGNETRRGDRLEKENGELKKENGELKERLGFQKCVIIRDIPWVFEILSMVPLRGTKKINVLNRLGTALCHLCNTKGIKTDKVRDDKGNQVSTYPADIVELMHQYLLSKDESNYYYRMLSDYMK